MPFEVRIFDACYCQQKMMFGYRAHEPVWFSRKRSMAHTFSDGLKREDIGLSGSRKITVHISTARSIGCSR